MVTEIYRVSNKIIVFVHCVAELMMNHLFYLSKAITLLTSNEPVSKYTNHRTLVSHSPVCVPPGQREEDGCPHLEASHQSPLSLTATALYLALTYPTIEH